MVTRSSRLAALLAIVPAAVVGCRQGQESPVELPTVRLAVVAGAEHGGRPYSTPMTQEVTTTPPWQGDVDGTGQALITVNLGRREICWEESASNITLPATASHIHKAGPGIRGPIVVPLSPPGAGGTSNGCASGLDPELVKDILTNPAAYYVNIHTSDFPAGAVRGQLAN
jgi:CHRD domain-containing protein